MRTAVERAAPQALRPALRRAARHTDRRRRRTWAWCRCGPCQSWCLGRVSPGADVGRVSPGADVGQPRTRLSVGCAIGWRAGTTAGAAARSCATSARGAPATTRTSRTPSTHRLSGYSHRGTHVVLTRYSGYSRGTLGTHTVPRRPEVVHSLEDRVASGGEPPHSPGADVARGEPKSRCGFGKG